MRAATWMCTALIVAATTGPTSADTFHVSPAGADAAARDGKSAAAAWASLEYACGRVPAGGHLIQLAAGTFTAKTTARPKEGVTIAGRGRGATKVVADAAWPLVAREVVPRPDAEFLVVIEKAKTVTIRDLEFASDPSHRISGAVRCFDSSEVTLRNLNVRDFRWGGLALELSNRVEFDSCELQNASTEGDVYPSGSIRARWLSHSQIHHCKIANTIGHQVGYKAGGHEGMRFHHNFVAVQGEFAIESAHENEYGLEIDHNNLNRCISVPKGGQGDDPNTRKFPYSVRIHDNLLTDSYTVEGPRNHLRIDHNYIKIEKPGGRVYSQHGGDNAGPVQIDHNVVENVDRAFVWKNGGRAEKIEVFQNTVFLADAADRASAIFDAHNEPSQPIKGWVVRDNLFVCPASQPRLLICPEALPAVSASHNLCVRVSSLPPSNLPLPSPGLRLSGPKPFPFFAPTSATHPSIGAYEFGETPAVMDVPMGR